MSVSGDNLPQLLQKAREHSVAFVRPVLAEFGFTEQQWRVLKVLDDRGELNAQDIAMESSILSPSLSRILARLEVDGLIIRKSDSSDQRALVIKLSAKGRRTCKKISPLIDQQYRKLSRSMGPKTIGKLVMVLQAFNGLEN